MKKVHAFLDKLGIPNWLAIVLFASLLLRIPSFFEPYYYGDEMIYLTLGQGIRQGIPLYSGLHDNKPPVIYLLAAAAGSLVWFRAFLTIASLVAIYFFAKIVRQLFNNNPKVQKAATIIFALLTSLPLLEGNIANAENFILAFSLPAFYLLLAKKHSWLNLFSAGLLFSLAFLTKVPALFDLPVIFLFWLITAGVTRKSLKETFMKALPVLFGFAIPIGLTFLWFFFKGAFADYLKAAFAQNVGYLSTWRPGDVQKSFLVRNLPLLIRGLVVLAGLSTLYFFRRKLSKPYLLACVWLLLSLFAVTLSERPYPHYLLQAAPAISLLGGILIATRQFEQSLTIIPLTLAFFVPLYYRFWYYPTLPYYTRFAEFAIGIKSKTQYFQKFNAYTSRNYQIADFLVASSRPTDKVFVWGPDSPTIYALSRRLPPIKYVADYHVKDYSTKKVTAVEVSQKLPKFIILTPEAEPFAELGPILKTKYLLINKIEGAEIYVKNSL